MVPALPGEVKSEMAKREHRYRHLLWHGVRNQWLRLPTPVKQEIRDIDPEWEPPRPALDAQGNVLRDNDSGEDFLYMHRQVIGVVNDILAEVGDPNYTKIEGWERVPPPGDRDYPVPPAWDPCRTPTISTGPWRCSPFGPARARRTNSKGSPRFSPRRRASTGS